MAGSQDTRCRQLWMIQFVLLGICLYFYSSDAFTISQHLKKHRGISPSGLLSYHFTTSRRPRAPTTRIIGTLLPMCICVNCARVTNCSAYHFVEKKHEQPHMTSDPTFTPREKSPTIHVNVRTIRNEEEMNRMWKEHAEETKRAKARRAGLIEEERSTEDDLHGETVYNGAPVTTVEYDVVACEDFIEDEGCWVRNMPEEIRKANPDFVPT